MTTDSFFVPDGRSGAGRAFSSTLLTTGPWDERSQHGGPPTALIGHVLTADHPREDFQVTRLTVDILKPVPVARLHIATEVLRGGRSVELLGASVRTDDGTEVMSARMWRIRTADIPLDAGGDDDRLPGPEGIESNTSFFMDIAPGGYFDAMEVRFVKGSWVEHGPATAWMRMRHPLVPGVEPTPLERVLVAADSGNGLSASFQGIFINPDLSVYLTRPVTGEWVGVQAATTLTDHGVGLATSVLHDEQGPLGRGLQSLLLDVPTSG